MSKKDQVAYNQISDPDAKEPPKFVEDAPGEKQDLHPVPEAVQPPSESEQPPALSTVRDRDVHKLTDAERIERLEQRMSGLIDRVFAGNPPPDYR